HDHRLLNSVGVFWNRTARGKTWPRRRPLHAANHVVAAFRESGNRIQFWERRQKFLWLGRLAAANAVLQFDQDELPQDGQPQPLVFRQVPSNLGPRALPPVSVETIDDMVELISQF